MLPIVLYGAVPEAESSGIGIGPARAKSRLAIRDVHGYLPGPSFLAGQNPSATPVRAANLHQMDDLSTRLPNGSLVLDGGLGQELIHRGMPDSEPSLWSANALIEAPELVQEIHEDYSIE
jgi:hypothetical protein